MRHELERLQPELAAVPSRWRGAPRGWRSRGRARGRHPVADLADALVAADVLDRDARHHLVLLVDREPVDPEAGLAIELRGGDPALRVRRACRAAGRASSARSRGPGRSRRACRRRRGLSRAGVITPSVRGGSGWRSIALISSVAMNAARQRDVGLARAHRVDARRIPGRCRGRRVAQPLPPAQRRRPSSDRRARDRRPRRGARDRASGSTTRSRSTTPASRSS